MSNDTNYYKKEKTAVNKLPTDQLKTCEFRGVGIFNLIYVRFMLRLP